MTFYENRLISIIYPIFKAIKKYWIHIIICLIVILYFIYGPFLYYQIFVQEGKPIEVVQQPPQETGMIRYNIEDIKHRLNAMVFYEEETYEIWGWTFLNLEEKPIQSDYDRFIILNSTSKSLFFPVEDFWRPGVHETFEELGMNLKLSGFFVKISKNAIPTGLNCIGILFRHKQTSDAYYVNTMRGVIRTPNLIWLEDHRLDECR